MILEENDYLQHQLFLASVSPIKIRNRKRSRYINSFLILIWAGISYWNDSPYSAIFFGIAALLFFVAFPYYSKWFHQRHYTKFVKEHFNDRFGKNIEFEFRDDSFYSKDDNGDGSIEYVDTEIIYETGAYFIINFTDGDTFLIAKNKVDNLEFIKNKIQELQVKFGIPFEQKLDWVWK
jgi:hypothetical protein